MRKIKVALIRGWYLNPWEMMRYEPLKEEFDLQAIGTHYPLFDTSGVNLNTCKLHWPGEVLYLLGKAPSQFINRGIYKYFRYNLWMFGLTDKLKDCDILHSADTHHIFSLQAARIKKKYGCKLVLTVWENIPFQDEKRYVYRTISREVMDSTDIFLPVTQKSKEMLLVEGIPEEKIFVIQQPVDIKRFRPQDKDRALLQKFGCTQDELIILFVGRLHHTKGVEFLLQAFKRLIMDKSVPISSKLVIIGAGEREKSLKRLAEALGIAQEVIWCGAVNHDELPNYYATGDIFVLPSIPCEDWQEQFGMVLVEAMACGKPVISTHSGSIPDVVGDAGILVPPADSYSLHQALKQLVSTPGLISYYGKKARERTEGMFNPVMIAENTAGIYRMLAEHRNNG